MMLYHRSANATKFEIDAEHIDPCKINTNLFFLG